MKECWKLIEGNIKEAKETFVPSESFSARNSGQNKKKKKKKKEKEQKKQKTKTKLYPRLSWMR